MAEARSLRLYPQNFLLLVTIADLETLAESQEEESRIFVEFMMGEEFVKTFLERCINIVCK